MREEKGPNRGDFARDVNNHLLFEVCSEIGRQVGGVYTVLKTKAPVTTAEYGNRYMLIGRLDHQTAMAEFDALDPVSPELAEAMAALAKYGIKSTYCRWLVEGSPRVLLLDVKAGFQFFDEWRANFKELSGIELPVEDDMSNDTLVFGYLVAWFLGEFVRLETNKAVIAHFHEWPSSIPAYLAKKRKLDLTTIFTAHATVLGRELCAKSVDLYSQIEKLDAAAEAKACASVYHRHCIERAAAQYCDLLTTVSNITALECEYLLGRRADAVLPNGLGTAGSVVQTNVAHNEALHQRYGAKLKIRDFIRGHFYGQLDSFDADNSLYFFIAGRYEFTNKGTDMFIEALARLNERLKADRDSPTVVAFIIMPAKTTSVTTESLHRQAIVKSLRDAITFIERSITKKLFDRTLTWKEGAPIPTETELFSDEENAALRRRLYGIQRDGLPPVVTHNIVNAAEDPILAALDKANLRNDPSDKVKVVFYPEFLKASNPILPMDYDEFVRGTHLGVFPSKYEPWGYTPAECIAKGIPSITSNVSGFGSYMENLLADVNASDHGLYIVDRRTKSFDEAAGQLAEYMLDFCHSRSRERTTQRNKVENMADVLHWNSMNVEYRKARKMALRKAYPLEGYFFADEDLTKWMPEIAAQKKTELVVSLPCTPMVEM